MRKLVHRLGESDVLRARLPVTALHKRVFLILRPLQMSHFLVHPAELPLAIEVGSRLKRPRFKRDFPRVDHSMVSIVRHRDHAMGYVRERSALNPS